MICYVGNEHAAIGDKRSKSLPPFTQKKSESGTPCISVKKAEKSHECLAHTREWTAQHSATPSQSAKFLKGEGGMRRPHGHHHVSENRHQRQNRLRQGTAACLDESKEYEADAKFTTSKYDSIFSCIIQQRLFVGLEKNQAFESNRSVRTILSARRSVRMYAPRQLEYRGCPSPCSRVKQSYDGDWVLRSALARFLSVMARALPSVHSFFCARPC